MTQIRVRPVDNLVLELGYQLDSDATNTIVTLTDAQAAQLRGILRPNGGVTFDGSNFNFLPYLAPPGDPDVTDYQANIQLALNRLADITANGGTYTAVQVRDALIDLARIQRRTLLYLQKRVTA